MVLRYLARRALQQRALVPRVRPPSAGSRPVCTCGASPPQGVLVNESKPAAAAATKGNKVPEQLQTDFSKPTDEQICQELEKLNSMLKALIVDLKESARNQAIHKWCMMGAAATGAGLAFLRIAYDIHKKGEIALGEEGI